MNKSTDTITHQTWCTDHEPADAEGVEYCETQAFRLGPSRPPMPDLPGFDPGTEGTLQAVQGDDRDEPTVYVEWGRHIGEMDSAAVQALRLGLMLDPGGVEDAIFKLAELLDPSLYPAQESA
jgi:hypothetical protein